MMVVLSCSFKVEGISGKIKVTKGFESVSSVGGLPGHMRKFRSIKADSHLANKFARTFVYSNFSPRISFRFPQPGILAPEQRETWGMDVERCN